MASRTESHDIFSAVLLLTFSVLLIDFESPYTMNQSAYGRGHSGKSLRIRKEQRSKHPDDVAGENDEISYLPTELEVARESEDLGRRAAISAFVNTNFAEPQQTQETHDDNTALTALLEDVLQHDALAHSSSTIKRSQDHDADSDADDMPLTILKKRKSGSADDEQVQDEAKRIDAINSQKPPITPRVEPSSMFHESVQSEPMPNMTSLSRNINITELLSFVALKVPLDIRKQLWCSYGSWHKGEISSSQLFKRVEELTPPEILAEEVSTLMQQKKILFDIARMNRATSKSRSGRGKSPRRPKASSSTTKRSKLTASEPSASHSSEWSFTPVAEGQQSASPPSPPPPFQPGQEAKEGRKQKSREDSGPEASTPTNDPHEASFIEDTAANFELMRTHSQSYDGAAMHSGYLTEPVDEQSEMLGRMVSPRPMPLSGWYLTNLDIPENQMLLARPSDMQLGPSKIKDFPRASEREKEEQRLEFHGGSTYVERPESGYAADEGLSQYDQHQKHLEDIESILAAYEEHANTAAVPPSTARSMHDFFPSSASMPEPDHVYHGPIVQRNTHGDNRVLLPLPVTSMATELHEMFPASPADTQAYPDTETAFVHSEHAIDIPNSDRANPDLKMSDTDAYQMMLLESFVEGHGNDSQIGRHESDVHIGEHELFRDCDQKHLFKET